MPPCPSCGTSCHRLHAGSPAGGTRASASAHAHGSGDNRLRRRALSLIERLSPRRARSASFDERSRRLSDDLLRVKRGTLAVASRFASRHHADQSLDRGAGYPVGSRTILDHARTIPYGPSRVASLQNAMPYSRRRLTPSAIRILSSRARSRESRRMVR
jgi:hypothetical protein